MKAFIINMPHSIKRREFMEKQMKDLGIPYEIVSATVGKDLTDEEFRAIHDESISFANEKVTSLLYRGFDMSKTQVACAHSHARVYKMIKEQNLDMALVLEDDVVLSPTIAKLLSDKAFLQSEQFDWLHLDYQPVGLPFLITWTKNTWHNIKRKPIFTLYALLKFPYILVLSIYEKLREVVYKNNPHIVVFGRPLYLASAYVITKAGVDKVMPLTTPIRYPADTLPNQGRVQANLRMRVLCPLMSYQDAANFGTNIEYLKS
jgi:GR25 family glycosyltransferase involved in LPS biosynthesis